MHLSPSAPFQICRDWSAHVCSLRGIPQKADSLIHYKKNITIQIWGSQPLCKKRVPVFYCYCTSRGLHHWECKINVHSPDIHFPPHDFHTGAARWWHSFPPQHGHRVRSCWSSPFCTSFPWSATLLSTILKTEKQLTKLMTEMFTAAKMYKLV